MAKKKQVSDLEIEVPKDFVGEISMSRARALPPKIDPIVQQFGNGDLNILRDKINEIIEKR